MRPVRAPPASPGGGRIPLEQLLSQADIVSLHCPLTPETRNLINEQSLALMKPTAFLINTARGALVDEAALIEALRQKRIAAAALDVISKEPPPADYPIIQAAKELDNLIVTPHTAWSAREARERLLHEVKENIAAFLREQTKKSGSVKIGTQTLPEVLTSAATSIPSTNLPANSIGLNESVPYGFMFWFK